MDIWFCAVTTLNPIFWAQLGPQGWLQVLAWKKDRQGQCRNSRDNYLTGMHPVCCPVWTAQGGPLRMLVSVHLQPPTVWSNNSMRKMLWRLTNQVLICQTHQMKNGLLCLVQFTDKPHQERAGSPKHPMFAQLPGSNAHPNTDIYYSMLLKEHWQKNTRKQKDEPWVTTSVQYGRNLRKEHQQTVSQSQVYDANCAWCLCILYMMHYKGSSKKQQANTSNVDQIKTGLRIILLSYHLAGYAHKHSWLSLNPDPALMSKVKKRDLPRPKWIMFCKLLTILSVFFN